MPTSSHVLGDGEGRRYGGQGVVLRRVGPQTVPCRLPNLGSSGVCHTVVRVPLQPGPAQLQRQGGILKLGLARNTQATSWHLPVVGEQRGC